MLDICAKFYDHRSNNTKLLTPPPPPLQLTVQKSPCQIGLRGYVPDKILSDSISNKSKNVDNLYHLYLSSCMRQNTRLDLFHEKNWKGPLARHEKTNVLCIISSLNLFPSNSLKRLSISAFKSVSRYFDHIVKERN